MKANMVIAVLCSLISVSAIASSNFDSVSLSCKGRKLEVGNNGAEGTVKVEASSLGKFSFGNPWEINVSFEGTSLVDTTSVCGVLIKNPMKCAYRSPSDKMDQFGQPHSTTLRALCNDPTEFKVSNRASLTANVVLSADRSHGFFTCTSASGKISKKIELSECR